MAAASAPIAMKEALTVRSDLRRFCGVIQMQDCGSELIPWCMVHEHVGMVTFLERRGSSHSDAVFGDVTADEPRSEPAVHHLYTRNNGIGEVHMCERDVPCQQRGHHRHVPADAATKETYHC